MRDLDCSARPFKALMATLFFGALNDNIFKLTVSFLVLRLITSSAEQTLYMVIIGGLFIVPYILFSPHAGLLADRQCKAQVIRYVKWLELVLMSTGGFLLITENIPGLLIILFLMGTQSTFFSPCKYGILPEMLDSKDLSRGNGYTEFWTFLAIVLGTAAAGLLGLVAENSYLPAACTVVAVALLGLAASYSISPTGFCGTDISLKKNPVKELIHDIKEIRKQRELFLALLAIAYFWAYGALFQINALIYAEQVAHLSEFQTSVLLSVLAIGIGSGSILAGLVSQGKVELGLVPMGAFGLAVFSVVLSFSYDSYSLTLLAALALGLSGGFYIVPLNAFYQENAPLEKRGRYLAVNNFLCYVGMLFSSLLILICSHVFGLSAAQLFLVTGVLTFGVVICIFKKLPLAFLRCLNWLLAHSLYRLKISNPEHVPAQGGGLIVCNHMSYVDPMLVMASLSREVRFLMYRPIYEKRWIRPVVRMMKSIPVATDDSPKAILRAFKQAREALANGELVCIFAEGELSRIGRLLPFHRGLEQIMKGVDVPIIPLCLDQVWGSIFSYQGKKFFWKMPKELPYPITAMFGKPLPAHSKVHEVRQAVQELGAQAFSQRRLHHQILHHGFIRQAKRTPFRECLVDSTGKRLRYIEVLSAAWWLCRTLRLHLNKDQLRVGVVLPPSVNGALANISLTMSGRIPVNLEEPAEDSDFQNVIDRLGLSAIISSPKAPVRPGVELPQIALEDLLSRLTGTKKLLLLMLSLALPSRIIERLMENERPTGHSLCTLVPPTALTGRHNTVMLSHGNIASNIQSLYEIFDLNKSDTVLGILPFSRTFGFSITLWLPVLAGLKVMYHPDANDIETIGRLSKENQITILPGFPDLLKSCLNRCTREHLASLRHMVVGPDPLDPELAQTFSETFGLMPYGGYGCPELSPVAMVNIPSFKDEDVDQTGYKLGTVGHPIPGVAARIVDPETWDTLPPNTKGLLLVRGPNVMLGYLDDAEATAGAIREGWYLTGEQASIDDEGFVTIYREG